MCKNKHWTQIINFAVFMQIGKTGLLYKYVIN